MENIEIFDDYIAGKLSSEEKESFNYRIKTDPVFAEDFKIYLFTVKGIQRENEAESYEFGHAMKNISKQQLRDIIGRENKPKILRIPYLRERLAWASSVAAILIVGFFTVFNLQRSARYDRYDMIASYNYIPTSDRDSGEITDINVMEGAELKAYIPTLEKEYADAPQDDIQRGEDAGMRLAMAYLKLHDRDNAVKTLNSMKDRFSEDTDFVAKCNNLIEQIR